MGVRTKKIKCRALGALIAGGAMMALSTPALAGSYCGTSSCAPAIVATPAAPAITLTNVTHKVSTTVLSQCGSPCAPTIACQTIYSSCGPAPLVVRPAARVVPVVHQYVPVVRPVYYTYPVARVGCGVRYVVGHC